jgi:hypothetical protein
MEPWTYALFPPRKITGGKAMHVLAIRRPGQRGTQKLVALYGDRLVCVRYRYDAASGTRYKTVELIVDQAAWIPPPPHPHAPKPVIRLDRCRRPMVEGGETVAIAISNGRFPGAGTPDREAMNVSIYVNLFTGMATWFYQCKLFLGSSMLSTSSYANN